MTWLNWPNRLTITRIVLIAPLVICILNLNADWPHWRHIAMVIFIVMAIADGLDGYLARRLGEETPLGRFLDPVADKLLISCTVIFLAVESTVGEGLRVPQLGTGDRHWQGHFDRDRVWAYLRDHQPIPH